MTLNLLDFPQRRHMMYMDKSNINMYKSQRSSATTRDMVNLVQQPGGFLTSCIYVDESIQSKKVRLFQNAFYMVGRFLLHVMFKQTSLCVFSVSCFKTWSHISDLVSRTRKHTIHCYLFTLVSYFMIFQILIVIILIKHMFCLTICVLKFHMFLKTAFMKTICL